MMLHLEKGYDIRVIDSANFFPMRLAALPKAFGLKEMAKGYFPHFFNKTENWNYVGKYPPPEDYGIDSMSTNEREIFLDWHKSQKEDFNFQEQMLMYCRNDVQLLREACMKFREMLLDITGERIEYPDPETQEIKHNIENGIDPLAFLTIASVCMNVFRSKFLTENHSAITVEEKEKAERENRLANRISVTKKGKDYFKDGKKVEVAETRFINSPLAALPTNGYVARDQFSKISICWLE